MTGTTACAMWKIDFTLTANTRSNSASVTSSIGLLRCVVPALLMTISTRPKRLRVASTALSTSAAMETSHFTTRAELPISALTLCAPCSLRSAIVTSAPSRANIRAISAPNPEAPPVTSATLSSNLTCLSPCAQASMALVCLRSPHSTSDEINHASESSNLFRRRVVERCALVDDVDGDDFQRLVADDLEARMRYVAQIDRARAGRELDLLAVGRFDRRAFKHVKGFLAVMNMARDYFAGLVFGGRENDLHLGAGQVGALHLLAVRRILRLRKPGKSGGGNEDD